MSNSDRRAPQRYLGMTMLPREEEERLCRAPESELLRVLNRHRTTSRGSKPLLRSSDPYQLIQAIAAAGLAGEVDHNAAASNSEEETEVKRSEVKKAPTAELLAEYNKLTGKSIKKFKTRADGEKAVMKLLPKDPPGEGGGKVGRTKTDYTYRYLGEGHSKVRETSQRGAVLAALRERKKATRSELTEAVGFEAASYLQKLIELGHAEVVA